MVSFYKTRIKLCGLMPERALLRLRRGEIPLFDIRKSDKSTLLFSVWKKDAEKVFAIYPKVCYNSGEEDESSSLPLYTPYTVEELGAVGIGRTFESIKKRVGICIGVLLFAFITLQANDYIFGVQWTANTAYARETYQALEENGIFLWKKYDSKNADLVCAKLLSIDGVEFCSLKKRGHTLLVEIRTSTFGRKTFEKGEMIAKHTGEIVAMTALKGTPNKKIGEKVQAGETLVRDWFCIENGEQIPVEIIARVRIACTYEGIFPAEDKESAFAQAYLSAGLTGNERVDGYSVLQVEQGYQVTLQYTVDEVMNF